MKKTPINIIRRHSFFEKQQKVITCYCSIIEWCAIGIREDTMHVFMGRDSVYNAMKEGGSIVPLLQILKLKGE